MPQVSVTVRRLFGGYAFGGGGRAMAYMRGHQYLWRDESGLHIWSTDGYDGWDRTGWHFAARGEPEPEGWADADDESPLDAPSGVSIPMEIMDEYVVMRLAELLEEGRLGSTMERAVSKWGRESLRRNAPQLLAAFERAAAEQPDA